jgi:hypothetical protein
VAQDCLFLRGCGVLAKRPHTAVGIAADEVVGVEFDNRRCDHIKEFLYADVLLRHGSIHSICFWHCIISSPRKTNKKDLPEFLWQASHKYPVQLPS